MAWALTIHKSQGMTLPKATIDIRKTERQGLTFTAISRVPSLQDLQISPAFSFDRYNKMKDNKNIARRKHTEEILHSMLLQIICSNPYFNITKRFPPFIYLILFHNILFISFNNNQL